MLSLNSVDDIFSKMEQDPDFSALIEKSFNNYEKIKIFFDWDDTLCPSSWMKMNNVKEDFIMPQHLKDEFAALAPQVIRVLTLAKTIGEVVIVTNATSWWIPKIISICFPQIAEIMSSIRIISARDRYHHKYPFQNETWKKLVFIEEINGYNLTKVISIGDSDDEKNGIKKAVGFFSIICKTVKFFSQPNIDLLNNQLYFLEQNLSKFLNDETINDFIL
jgi:hypothetical protein